MISANALPISTLTLLLLFGSNLALYVVVLTYTKTRGLVSRLRDGDFSMALTDDAEGGGGRVGVLKMNFASMMTLSHELAVLAAILLYVWVCEFRPPNPHGFKEHNMDFYWFISILLLLIATRTKHRDPKENHDILNRDQTEEWKGWMQVAFLLYHYFEAHEVYNSVRVMISCYVWMTGFGNLSFFYIKGDFGFVRFYQMFWRLNFLVVLLCMLTNNMYILYYICPLHTFYFFMTYAVMVVFPKMNHTKYGLRVKLLVLGCIIWAVWEIPAIFDLTHFFLDNSAHPGAPVGAYGVRYEWHFRSGLDHWSTFYGMIFALNFPLATLWLKKVEKLPVKQQILVKGVPAVIMCSATVWWATNILPLPKAEYNSKHPYMFMIPLTTYIFMRNITPELRKVHLGLLAEIGKVTLETYLMQHHIWLTSSAKTLLEVVPQFPMINFLLVTVVYVLVSRRLYRITISLRAMLIPEETSRAILWLVALMAVLGLFAGMAAILQFVDGGAFIVTIVMLASSVGLLFASYVAVHGKQTRSTSVGVVNLFKENMGLSAVVVAGSALGIFALIFPITPSHTAAPVLGPQCVSFANSGAWTTDEVFCGENNLATCDSSRWRWHVPRTCRFQHKSQKDTTKILSKAPMTVFVGDETIFNLFTQTQRAAEPNWSIPAFAEQDLWIKGSGHSLKYMFQKTPKEVAKYITGTADLQPDAIVAGSATPGGPELASAMRSSKIRTRIVVLPPMLVSSVLDKKKYTDGRSAGSVIKFAESLNATFHSASTSGVIDLLSISSTRADLSIDGVLYEPPVYAAGSQILLNMLSFIEEPPPSLEGKDGAGPGVPHNPMYGAMALALGVFMIFFMDAYALTYVTYWLVPGLEKITWEDAVERLHASIGVGNALPKSNSGSPSGATGSAHGASASGLELASADGGNMKSDDDDEELSETVPLTARTHDN